MLSFLLTFVLVKAKEANVVGVLIVEQAFDLLFELFGSACSKDLKG